MICLLERSSAIFIKEEESIISQNLEKEGNNQKQKSELDALRSARGWNDENFELTKSPGRKGAEGGDLHNIIQSSSGRVRVVARIFGLSVPF